MIFLELPLSQCTIPDLFSQDSALRAHRVPVNLNAVETIPCPGCRTDLEPSATVCPICLRPRGKLEITRAYATLRLAEKQRRQRPFLVAGYLLAAAAASWLLYRFHDPIV